MHKVSFALIATYLTSTMAIAAEDRPILDCELTAICEMQDACRVLDPPIPLLMTPRPGGYMFKAPDGDFVFNWVNQEQEDFQAFIIPLQNGSWGSVTLFKNGQLVMTQSALKQGRPYSSQGHGTCVTKGNGQ